jgi:deoxyribonuclease-1-like protein
MRRPFLIAAVLTGLALSGCNVEQAPNRLADQRPEEATKPSANASPAQALPINQEVEPAPASNGDTIQIASFNIQVFGTLKMSKTEVIDVLSQVVTRFDVVAIQEVRSKDQSIVPKFVEMVNARGARYDYVIGPRLGRTSSKEQYVYLFDTTRIEVVPDSVYTAEDPLDLLHREPLVARFRVRGPPADKAFTFSLVNIHTDPDETDQELDALDDVFLAVRADGSGEDDVILLGDLNVDEFHLGELCSLPNVTYAVSNVTTNTRRTKSYDNIVFDQSVTGEYAGKWGVVDLTAEYGLSLEEALKVSDHLPVWAEFSIEEAGTASSVATRPATTTR